MTKQITITILAEDILKNSYFGANTCPITRALKRGGYNELYDGGLIMGTFDGEDIAIDTSNKDYKKMLDKVLGMYHTKTKNSKGYIVGACHTELPIEDFTVTINF